MDGVAEGVLSHTDNFWFSAGTFAISHCRPVLVFTLCATMPGNKFVTQCQKFHYSTTLILDVII